MRRAKRLHACTNFFLLYLPMTDTQEIGTVRFFLGPDSGAK